MKVFPAKFLTILFTLFNTILSLVPVKVSPKILWQDKISHFIMYGMLSLAAVKAFKQERWKNYVAAGVCYACSLGLALEFVQFLLPYREFDGWDIWANFLGSLAGAYTVVVLMRGRSDERKIF